jgi:hypothetical protein
MLRIASRAVLFGATIAIALLFNATPASAGPVATAPLVEVRVESSITSYDYVAEQQAR